jgi:hypothetical protein
MRQFYPFVRLLIILVLLLGNAKLVRAQDIPGVSANIQTAPAGTIVIAMDNTNQATSTINASSGTYLFNLKAYGLVTLLRNAGIYVKWVIRTGKAKDEIDFTVDAERIYPTSVAAQSLNFSAGPFVIFPSDSLGADYLIQWFNYSMSDSSKVKVYRTTADVDVDVRYTLTNPLRAALLHDSCDIHRNYMEMASVPSVNYDCLDNAAGLINGCYTIVTIPHSVSNDLAVFDSDSIYNFVMAGGNMLAACEGIQTFEGLRLYQSSGGTLTKGTGGGHNNNVFYDNVDLAYSQFEGIYRPRTRGALQNWRYNTATANNFFSVVRSRPTANGTDYYSASACKMTSDLGSLIFYHGNHEFYTYDCHTCLSGAQLNVEEVNGMRLYLNAVQIPTKIIPCVVLDVTLRDFTAQKQTNETVLLQWNTLSEIDNEFYIIEHSTDGKNFFGVGKQFSRGNAGPGHNYSFIHTNPRSGVNYYRLRSVDNNGRAGYSSLRKVVFGKNDLILTLFPNPAKSKATLMLDVKDGQKLNVRLIDGSGRTVKQQSLTVKNQLAELNIDGVQTGMYVLIAVAENGEQFKNKLLVKD